MPRFEAYPQLPCVVDPVMIATSGAQLVADTAIDAPYKAHLFTPILTLATPNIDEAQILLGQEAIDHVLKKTRRVRFTKNLAVMCY